MRVVSLLPIFLAATTLSAGGSVAIAAPEPVMLDLGWLQGCWVHEDGGTEEHWIDTGHGLLFGHAVTMRDGRLVAFEDLRIEPGGHGPVYVASPGGRPPVSFQYVDGGEAAIEFENPDHDFPQRIAYMRDGDTLTASIGKLDGTSQIHFPMTACSADNRGHDTGPLED